MFSRSHMKRSEALLQSARDLIDAQNSTIKKLQDQNIRLAGEVFQLSNQLHQQNNGPTGQVAAERDLDIHKRAIADCEHVFASNEGKPLEAVEYIKALLLNPNPVKKIGDHTAINSNNSEATPMNQEIEQRAINLSDASARATDSGNHDLADKLSKQAEKLLALGNPVSFEDWAGTRNLNLEKYEGAWVSKHTAELAECWAESRG